MIDTNELRRLAQAATPHVGHACKYQDAHWLREGHVDFENADLFIASERPQEDAAFYAAANPTTVIEILDRLEAAESECLEQARLNGMGGEREAALLAKLEAAEKERDDAKAAAENIALKLDYLRSKLETAENAQNEWLRANAPGGWIDNLRVENEAAEKERDDVAQQLVQSEIGKREISEAHNAVTRRLSVLADENTALRAKMAEIERQKPVGKFTQHPSNGLWEQDGYGDNPDANPLYALPGAKGEEK